MLLPLPEDEWKLKVNAQYQDAMKIVLNLATACLVLPIFLMQNLTSIKPGERKIHLNCWAYASWIFLFASIAFGLLFYYYSTKYVKVVCAGYKKGLSEGEIEIRRDVFIWLIFIAFLVGLFSLGVFFYKLQ